MFCPVSVVSDTFLLSTAPHYHSESLLLFLAHTLSLLHTLSLFSHTLTSLHTLLSPSHTHSSIASTLTHPSPPHSLTPHLCQRLGGESEAEYVARQEQLKKEARERLRQKFGSKTALGGVGSDGDTNKTRDLSSNRVGWLLVCCPCVWS